MERPIMIHSTEEEEREGGREGGGGVFISYFLPKMSKL